MYNNIYISMRRALQPVNPGLNVSLLADERQKAVHQREGPSVLQMPNTTQWERQHTTGLGLAADSECTATDIVWSLVEPLRLS